MSKFKIGDSIKNNYSGEIFQIAAYHANYRGHVLLQQYYEAFHQSGSQCRIYEQDADDWTLVSNPQALSSWISGNQDEVTISLADPRDTDNKKSSDDCQHDWVTWTGLFGTQTDCSKCKEVKNG